MLMRCGRVAMTGAGMTGATLGGMAMLAATGPFLAGLGVGAAVVGGACLARREMKKRNSWRDEDRSAPEPLAPGEDAAIS